MVCVPHRTQPLPPKGLDLMPECSRSPAVSDHFCLMSFHPQNRPRIRSARRSKMATTESTCSSRSGRGFRVETTEMEVDVDDGREMDMEVLKDSFSFCSGTGEAAATADCREK